MKKILLGVFLFIFILSACISPTPTKTPKPPKTPKAVEEVQAGPEISVFQEAQDGKPFRFAHGQYGDIWMGLLLAGWLQACEDYGLLCEHSQIAGTDEAPVLAYVDLMTSENTSGVMIGMWMESRYITGNQLVEKGIPFVAPHVGLEEGIVPGMIAWVGPDPEAYSVATGRKMAEKANCEGPIAFSQSGLAPMENQVTEGFQKGFREVCPDTEFLEKISIGPTDMAKSIALSVAEFLVHPDIKVAFSSTANGGQAWAKAAEESGKEPGEILIQGMDYMPANLDMVKSGDIWLLVGQPVYEEGYYSVVLLVNNLMGLPVPYGNSLPAPLITSENVDGFYVIVEKAEAAATK